MNEAVILLPGIPLDAILLTGVIVAIFIGDKKSAEIGKHSR